MTHLVSILIPTIRRHTAFLTSLKLELTRQILPFVDDDIPVQILVDDNERDQIGVKRNRLLEQAQGNYVAFFDADDYPGPTYISRMIEAAKSGCHCASLKGDYTVDGKFDGVFEHSVKYNQWRNDLPGEVKYERNPNHLNLIRRDISLMFKFPPINHGEDHDWSKQLQCSGLLKDEFYIPEIIYHYRKLTNHV